MLASGCASTPPTKHKASPPSTEGCATAQVVTKYGMILIISNAHYMLSSANSFLATGPIKDKAIPDLEQQVTASYAPTMSSPLTLDNVELM